jgi:hypothetical protein
LTSINIDAVTLPTLISVVLPYTRVKGGSNVNLPSILQVSRRDPGFDETKMAIFLWRLQSPMATFMVFSVHF